MSLWQFWIDVGGTFTDCLARGPDGSVRAYKVLSSGVVKGRVEEVLSDGRLRCSGLDDYETGFFDDYEIRRLGPSGSVEQTGRVVGFEAVGSAEDGRLLEVTPSASQWRDLFALGSFELDGGEPAPLLAIRCSLGLRLREPIGEVDVRLGTTLGTNALLERTGATTALVTTEGFADVLRIGNQNRPRLFELDIRKSEPLHEVVVEIGGRLSADGEVVEPIDRDRLTLQIAKLVEDGVDAIAVCLLNSYRNDSHERVVAEVAAGLGCAQVSLSSEISPTQKIVARGHTTLVDAYLTPVIRRFVAALRDGMPEARLRLMTSAGGLVEADDCSGFDTVLSGPAGGVVALSEVAERAGIDLAIGFDMGGTSTDVSRFSGEFTYEYEAEKAGVKIVAPMLAIETVAAGGGSICDFDGQKLRVGPLSAGADPGPACYGRGGPLAVTDMNLYLGRLEGSQFPFTLARSEVSEALAVLRDRIADEQGRELGLEELAEGFLQIANANMAAAIQKISIALGYDLREYILVSFGGAGGQHACAVASELGMRSVLVHPFSGVLSAYGMGVADVKKFAVRTVLERYDAATLAKLEPLFVEVEANLRRQILVEGVSADRIQPPRRQVELRYHGQSSTLTVEGRSDPDPLDAFEEQHRKLYGHVFEGREVEIVAARVEMIGVMDKVEVTRRPEVSGRPPPDAMARTYFGSTWTDAGIYRRSRLSPGDELQGPAIVVEPTATTVVEPGWRCRMLSTGDLLLESAEVGSLSETDSSEADPIELELFNNRFAAIAEQMGAILQRTSLSVNVKERLDFSCALFTSAGSLVASAPHMPVHLGAMSETVRCLLEDVPALERGDVLITNDPFRGGSHLPDITVVTPVFGQDGRRPIFFTASRAHHADVGGTCPGSMPPDSRCLEDEGVLIRAFKIVAKGEPHFAELRDLLVGAEHPARSPDENLADVGAQIAANQAGATGLLDLIGRFGWDTTSAYMLHVQDAAEAKLRASLERLPDGVYSFEDRLDEGSRIRLRLEIRGDRAHLDFTGTSPRVRSNLNANRAIVKAAVIYCFRCLIDEDIPLNEGVLAPLELTLPVCLLNPLPGAQPSQSPAVVGGNVETSQRVTDVILGALGLAAASQGTMNNLTFGNEHFGYYETICGGAGAGRGFAGADAVHTHMTNTRLTDPEVLEGQYPVRLRRFEIRRGSGGGGRYRGGDGVRREIEFLEPLQVAILSQRRTCRPFGLEGGEAGAAGRNTLLPRDGEPRDLGSVASFEVLPGDRIRIETPGGGGWGELSSEDED